MPEKLLLVSGELLYEPHVPLGSVGSSILQNGRQVVVGPSDALLQSYLQFWGTVQRRFTDGFFSFDNQLLSRVPALESLEESLIHLDKEL